MLRSFARVVIAAMVSLASLMSFSNRTIAAEVNGLPSALQQAIDQGPVDPTQQITITVQLNKTNQGALDQAVEALYDPTSPQYEHWMNPSQLRAYAPSAQAVAAVKAQLQKNGLTVLSVDPLGFSVRARGTVANVEQAFQIQIHQYTRDNKTYWGHAQPAVLTGGADAYVQALIGLDGSKIQPLALQAVDPKTGKKPAAIRLGPAAAALETQAWNDATDPAIVPSTPLQTITNLCVTAPQSLTFYGFPEANYYGNIYSANPSLTCSFTAQQLQNHYGLTAAYLAGYAGTGQTVVLVEGYGYPTIQADANEFSKLNHLPLLNSSNFEVVYPDGPNPNPNLGVETGWDIEIAIDVQTAHSIAPNAKIVVVATYSQTDEDFLNAITYVTNHGLGTTVNNSWEINSEFFSSPAQVAAFNNVLQEAAAQGISVNFSTGDGGDEGNGSPFGAPNVPSDSPFATAVGGTSILRTVNGGTAETGWGDVVTYIGSVFYGPSDPPEQIGFIGGGGGGESVFNAQPKWQKFLPGTGRQLPDVSALADPYTGVTIVITEGGTQYFQSGWGGTSVACPIVTAFWALATEAAGHTLGQAAPQIAHAKGNQLKDVVPVTTPDNAFGTITDFYGTTSYSPFSLISLGVEPPNTSTVDFVSALWINMFGFGDDYVFAFGLDTSLSVTTGWDNVTGFGTPNGLNFVTGFN